MSKNLIIHIGLHKTGTTYLQYNFFPMLKDVLYIHGNQFFRQWQQQSWEQKGNCLISYEGFSGLAWNLKNPELFNLHWIDSFEQNIENLSNFFPNAIILTSIRKPSELLISMYKQYIQEGGVLKLADFYNQNGVIRNEDLVIINRIKYIQSKFERSYFLNYESFRKNGDDYLLKFFRSEFNIVCEVKKNRVKSTNGSILGNKLEFLRKVNYFYNKTPLSIRQTLKLFRLTPRDIIQNKLNFWESFDKEEFLQIKENLNIHFEEEWKEFERFYQWKD